MHVALIDDDPAVLNSLTLYLKRQGMVVTCFATADAFVARQQSPPFDCVVADVRMPGLSGIDLVRRFAEEGRATPIILITGHGDIEMAVAAIMSITADGSDSTDADKTPIATYTFDCGNGVVTAPRRDHAERPPAPSRRLARSTSG